MAKELPGIIPMIAYQDGVAALTMQQPPADLLISVTPGIRKLVEAAVSLGP